MRTHAISSPGEELVAFGREEDVPPVQAVSMSRRISPARNLVALFRLWLAFLRLRPVIVDAHTPKGGLLGLLAAFAARVPVRVYHVHGLVHLTSPGLRRALLRATERVSCACATRVLAVSPSIARALCDDGLCPPGKVGVVESGSIDGIDTRRFSVPADDERRAAREGLGIPPDARVLGFVGRLVRDKGVLELEAAWARLREEFPELHLVVLGPLEGEDADVRAAVARLRVDGRVRSWLGSRHAQVLPRHGRGGAPLVSRGVRPRRVGGERDGAARGRDPDPGLRRRGGMRSDWAPGAAPRCRRVGGRARAVPSGSAAPGRARSCGRLRAEREFGQDRIWRALGLEYERLFAAAGVAVR